MSHKQLTQEQRYHLYGLWRAGYNQVQMAKELGVNKSTISREFKRNTRWNGYSPGQAQWSVIIADAMLRNALSSRLN